MGKICFSNALPAYCGVLTELSSNEYCGVVVLKVFWRISKYSEQSHNYCVRNTSIGLLQNMHIYLKLILRCKILAALRFEFQQLNIL